MTDAPGPSELARELSQAATSAAEEIGDFCIERPYRNYMLTLAAQIIQRAIDRELAKVHAIPAETLDQAIEAMGSLREKIALELSITPERWGVSRLAFAEYIADLDAALSKLRAAKSEGGKP